MRIWISLILRLGVILSSALILTGGVLFLIQHPNEIPSFKTFSGQPDRLKHIGIIFNEALQLRSRSVIQAGVLVLLSTPLLRVIFSFIEFLIHKDWIFVVITAIVLFVLLYSLSGV
jgi:uncharacterized membrane protein